MTDTQNHEGSERADPLLRDRVLHSIVPRDSIAGSTLSLVIAIMAFLANLTLGSVFLINDTASGWQNDISREVTIQVRPVDGIDQNEAVRAALRLASSFAGVRSASVVDARAMGELLEPWLGSGLDLRELPVPQLISVRIDRSNPPDFEALRKLLREAVAGASLDDHGAWLGRLTTMAQATVAIGVLIFVLMMAATVLTVIFATRGAMAGNRHIVEVLHFVGAEQSYIASQFQRHFLMLGLKGSFTGGVLAIVFFLTMGIWTSVSVADPAADQVTALFGTFSVGFTGYGAMVLLIFVIALLTALTSRMTVFRHVGMLDRSAAVE